jgi:hypothetical protein
VKGPQGLESPRRAFLYPLVEVFRNGDHEREVRANDDGDCCKSRRPTSSVLLSQREARSFEASVVFQIVTGSDAKKPLPFAEQIERSNRWNGRDVKIGAGHLAFWEDFLTSGAPIVDLSLDGVDNLLLGRSLLQFPSQTPT